MTINCNVTGNERKRLAQVLGAILLVEPVYTKAPAFAYVVGDYTIDKIGTISCPDSEASETVAQIVEKLTAEGFTPEVPEDETPAETPDVAAETEAETMPEAEATEANVGMETPETEAENAKESQSIDGTDNLEAIEDETKLTVSIPRDKLPDDALARLRTMVSNKEVLFKRALSVDTLPIEVAEDKVSFPWFTLTGTDGEAEAYTQFITYLCKMAVEQTRVLDKPYNGDNDRFAMRIFMVRLGMKGAQFALARKLMMKNLTGNSGWRFGAPPKKAEETLVTPAKMPEVQISGTPSDVETAEEAETPVPEEAPNATADGTATSGESTPDEKVPDPVEAASEEGSK